MHHTTSTTFHPDLIVNGPIVETEEEFRVSARLKDEVVAELRPAHYHRHDLRTIVVADIPAYSDRQGRYLPVVIEVQIPRFKDPKTGDTVLCRPPSLPAGYKATSRLLAAIDDAWIEPSAGLANRLCLPESTVRQIRMRRLKDKDAAFRPVASDIIGIDEVHVGRMALRLQSHSWKRGLGVITAPKGNRILAMTRDTKQASIEQALRGLAHLDRVCFVTIDMTARYRAAIQAVLPAAKIIIDRWHVTRLVTEVVQDVRKRLVKTSADRKKLPRQHWLIAQPPLKANEEAAQTTSGAPRWPKHPRRPGVGDGRDCLPAVVMRLCAAQACRAFGLAEPNHIRSRALAARPRRGG